MATVVVMRENLLAVVTDIDGVDEARAAIALDQGDFEWMQAETYLLDPNSIYIFGAQNEPQT